MAPLLSKHIFDLQTLISCLPLVKLADNGVSPFAEGHVFCFHSRSASFSISPAIIWGRRANASRREMMAVAGIVATSLLGISWAPSPARWGHHHSGITSRGPGGGPSVSHHAAARALEGPDGAPVPGPPGSGHHWHRGRPRCWRAAAAVAPGRGLGGGGTTVQPSAVHRRCSPQSGAALIKMRARPHCATCHAPAHSTSPSG